MDESSRKSKRLIALVSQRRKNLERLEQEVIRARQLVADAEMELARFQQGMRGQKKADTLHEAIPRETAATKAARAGESTCNAAGKALRKCKRARERGDSADTLCGEAGRALRRCAATKKRGKY